MKKGFTLIETIISIALYSIILVMISSMFFAVSRLGDFISGNSNSRNEFYLLEKIIKQELYNGTSVTTNEDYLFSIDGSIFIFNDNKLLKNNKVIFENKDLINIYVIKVNEYLLTVELVFEKEGKLEVILIEKMIT